VSANRKNIDKREWNKMKSSQQNTKRMSLNVGKTDCYICETMRNGFIFIFFHAKRKSVVAIPIQA
jgi:hypothetical protein